MKSFMAVFFTTFLLISFSNDSVAQANEWEWNEYGIGFATYSDCKVETNNSEEFSSECDGIYVSIFPWKDDNLTVDDLANEVTGIASEIGYAGISDAEEIELNDFEGAFVVGVQDGVNALIIGLLDPNSATNFYIVIAYGDEHEDDAIGIATSFKKL